MTPKMKPTFIDPSDKTESPDAEENVVETGEAIKRKYHAVLQEPIPPRLTALINRLRLVEKSRDS